MEGVIGKKSIPRFLHVLQVKRRIFTFSACPFVPSVDTIALKGVCGLKLNLVGLFNIKNYCISRVKFQTKILIIILIKIFFPDI